MVFPSEKDPVPILHEAGWASWPVWTVRENLARTWFELLIVQPVQGRYTDYAVPLAKSESGINSKLLNFPRV